MAGYQNNTRVPLPWVPLSGALNIHSPLGYEFSDEADDYEAPRASEKIVLPSAPRASLGPNISDDRIPKEPPFTAYLANLSYDINPEDVYDFFGKLKINNVRLLRDGDQETGRLKG